MNSNGILCQDAIQAYGRIYFGDRLICSIPNGTYLFQLYPDGSGNIYMFCGVNASNPMAYVSSNGTWQFYNPLWNNDGSITNPMYSFTNETGLGMYRNGSNKLSFCSNSVDAFDITNTEVYVNVPLSCGTNISIN